MINMQNNDFWLQQNFDWRFLQDKRETFSWTLTNAEPATATNYNAPWIMPRSGTVEEFWEVHGTACSSTGTLQLEKLSSGTALDSGTVVLSTALALNTTADTPQRGTLSTTLSARQFVRGDRFALKDANTLTATANLTVMMIVKYKNV